MLKAAVGRSAQVAAAAFPSMPPRGPFPILLDSADGGRYSFAGADPAAVLIARGDRLALWREEREETLRGNPFDALRGLLAEHRVDNPEGLPLPGGAVGAFGYDLGQHLERLPHRAEDDLDFPDLVLGFYDSVFFADHAEGRTGRLDLTPRAVKRAIDPRAYEEVFGAGAPAARPGPNFTREAYLAAILRIKEYIAAGDVYQVNLSQRFHARAS